MYSLDISNDVQLGLSIERKLQPSLYLSPLHLFSKSNQNNYIDYLETIQSQTLYLSKNDVIHARKIDYILYLKLHEIN